MTHPSEYLYTKNLGGGYRACTTQVLSAARCDKVLSSSTTGYSLGPAYYWARDASHHTVQDRLTGWRPPRSYYCTKISAGQIPSGFVGVNKHPCPTWKWIGMPADAAKVWPWSTQIGQTPFERNGGFDKSNMQDWVKTKAITKLNRFELNLGEAFLERKQTYALVHDGIKDLRWFLAGIRQGNLNVSRTWQYLRESGSNPWDAWLKWRYGWNPLWSDISGAIDLIEKLENGSYQKLHVYVKSHKKLPYNEIGERDLVSLYGAIMFRSRYSVRGEELVKVRYDYNLRNENYVTASSLGISPNSLWEAKTLSFVADWFLNVGQWLEAWSLLPGWTYQCGSMTTVGKYWGRASAVPAAGKVLDNGGEAAYYAFKFERAAQTIPVIPSLAINPAILQGLLSGLGGMRIADAVALLKQDINITKKFLRG